MIYTLKNKFMPNKTCYLYIDDEPYNFEVNGEFFWGKDELLYDKNDNIISKMPWKNSGFKCVSAFEDGEFQSLKKSITQNIIKAIRLSGISVDESFSLNQYHQI